MLQIFAKRRKKRFTPLEIAATMRKPQENKSLTGFTLIELLVAIAIIGLLASIVLAFLGGRRAKAKDAKIIAGMVQLRSIAELHYSNTGSYNNLCINTDVVTLRYDIKAQGGMRYLCTIAPPPNYNSYCIEVKLNSGKWWCVDSALRSKQYDTNPVCDEMPPTVTRCE